MLLSVTDENILISLYEEIYVFFPDNELHTRTVHLNRVSFCRYILVGLRVQQRISTAKLYAGF